MDLRSSFLKQNKINLKRAKKVLKDYDRDENGNIVIKDGTFIISKTSVRNYSFSDSWILISQPGVLNRQGVAGKMALVKSYISDKCPEYCNGLDAEITRANNFILPQIARQFQLEAADYYNVTFEDCDELQSEDNFRSYGTCVMQKIKPKQRYLLTPSFKKNDEELIHYADILKNQHELGISQMMKEIEQYLKRRRIPETDIEMVKHDFIKQCIFNKFIEFSDEHNLNGGLLIKESREGRRARISPCYDLDFAAGAYNLTNGGIVPKHFFRHSDDGKTFLQNILNQFKGDFEKEYLKEIMPKINIKKAMEEGEKYGNFKLSEMARNKYNKFFEKQISELKEFYNLNYVQKNIEER